MKVVFLIRAEQTTSGRAELATYQGRLLIATNAGETDEVPYQWLAVDLDAGAHGLQLREDVDTITVAEWLETLRD